MNFNAINQAPFVKTSRLFPEDMPSLIQELTVSYTESSSALNDRIIGLYPSNRPAVTGQSYYITTQKKQGLRQIYTFQNTNDIPIGFKLSSIFTVPHAYGSYKSGTFINGLIFGTNGFIANQISFYLAVDGTSTQSDLIKFRVDAGAPALNSGIIILEWISNT